MPDLRRRYLRPVLGVKAPAFRFPRARWRTIPSHAAIAPSTAASNARRGTSSRARMAYSKATEPLRIAAGGKLVFRGRVARTVAGRSEPAMGIVLEFPDDVFMSPTHANFFYRNTRLVVRDEGSLNGVYLRVRGTVDIAPGDIFLAGDQVLRLELTPKASDAADADGTFFYTSPKFPTAFRVSQLLQGGAAGCTVGATSNTLHIGREDCDLNFPLDVHLDRQHCTITEKDGKFQLTDSNTHNGTYMRIKTERELGHGDYVFLGRRLLRVELNA